jgi:hypothetical protein
MSKFPAATSGQGGNAGRDRETMSRDSPCSARACRQRQAPAGGPSARALLSFQPLVPTVFFSEEANLPPRPRQLAAQKNRYDKGVESIVVEGIRRGAFREAPPRLVVFGLLGMLNWLYKWYNPSGRWGAEEISGAFLTLVEGGLLTAPRRGPRLSKRLRRLRRELQSVERALDG